MHPETVYYTSSSINIINMHITWDLNLRLPIFKKEEKKIAQRQAAALIN
jgi:hypothetical protein